jgi:hypothetical protein
LIRFGQQQPQRSSKEYPVLVAALLVLCLAGGCGTRSSPKPSPVFSNVNLSGNYTYRIGGVYFDAANGTQSYSEAGTFVADGQGNITAGIDDFVENSTLSTGQVTGTYSVAKDGTGTITINPPRGSVTFAFALLSDSSMYLIEYDSLGSGDGIALPQSVTALSMAPAGTFIFHFHSSLANSAALGAVSAVGQMTITNGSISGTEDIVRAGIPGLSSLTGSLTSPDSHGRGTAVFIDSGGSPSNYLYYIVDSHTLKFLETDPGPLGGGRADLQSSAPFSDASLNQGFTFRGRGDTLTNSFGANCAGAFVSDGNGHLINGSYDSVQDGISVSDVPVTGSYNVASNGRATITLNPQGMNPISLTAWMVSPSYGFFLVNAADLAQDGRLDQQEGAPFSTASLNGRSAFYMFGSESPTSPWIVRVGVVTFDGNNGVNFTNYYANHSGSTAQHGSMSGNYVVGAGGRVDAFSVGSTTSQVIYLTSDGSGSLMLDASGSEMAGSIGTAGAGAGD